MKQYVRIPSRTRAAVARRRAVWAAAHLAGENMSQIARRWGVDRSTVRLALNQPRRRS